MLYRTTITKSRAGHYHVRVRDKAGKVVAQAGLFSSLSGAQRWASDRKSDLYKAVVADIVDTATKSRELIAQAARFAVEK